MGDHMGRCRSYINARPGLSPHCCSNAVEGIAATICFSFLWSSVVLLPVGGVCVYRGYKRKHVASCRHASSTQSFNSDIFTSFPDIHSHTRTIHSSTTAMG